MICAALVAAAGRGTRMGGPPKQFLELGGRPVLVRAIEIFERCSRIASIWVVVAPEHVAFVRDSMLPLYGFDKVAAVVAGGDSRQASVYRGLQAMGAAVDTVAIHDGARPLLPPEVLERALDESERSPAVVVAVPVKDTMKVVHDRSVLQTPDRAALWAAQTPQIFRRELIVRAYRQADQDGYQGTDDASLAERLGAKVRVVEGSPENLKLTTPDDLVWAELLLHRRG